MRKIIGTKLYDTEKAKKIYSYRQRRKTFLLGDYNFYSMYDVDIYKTKKGNYFIHGHKENDSYNQFIEEIEEKEVMEIINKLNVDKYLELWGDEIEEA